MENAHAMEIAKGITVQGCWRCCHSGDRRGYLRGFFWVVKRVFLWAEIGKEKYPAWR